MPPARTDLLADCALPSDRPTLDTLDQLVTDHITKARVPTAA